MVDCCDFSAYKATLVLNGTALLIQKPAVPYFLLHDYEPIFLSEVAPCPRTKDAHAVHANRIRRVLLVFPDGMTCATLDGTTKKKPKDKNKIKMCLRYLSKTYPTPKAKEKEATQEFYPAHWVIRIHDEQRRLLKADEEDEEEDDIDAAFQGMKV
jgi:hypothetical protein